LAFILSLPSLSMGAVEYPSAIGPQSMVVVTGEFSDEKPKYHPSVDQIGPKDSYKQSKVGDVKILADAILAADGEVDYSAYRHIIVSLITRMVQRTSPPVLDPRASPRTRSSRR
jgi:hypothetical protein